MESRLVAGQRALGTACFLITIFVLSNVKSRRHGGKDPADAPSSAQAKPHGRLVSATCASPELLRRQCVSVVAYSAAAQSVQGISELTFTEHSNSPHPKKNYRSKDNSTRYHQIMSTDIVMEEEQGNTSQHLTEKKTSSKKRKSIATEPTGDSTENTTTEPASKKKEKKNKGKQDATTTEDADNETTSKKKKSKQTTNNDTENDADQNVNLDALSPIAHPLADKKLSKRVLRTVKKGSKQRRIKRGVKEVVKALRKGEKGLVVMAGDISPMDVLTHIPLLAEENGSGYIFVPTKESLGAASSTKRPTSCVMISTSRGGSEAMQKKFAEKKKALIAADPTKAAKIQADEDEYTTSFDAVLGEVLRLNEKISF
ncbi:hypothetical protein H4Q26_011715 [Puccinia striiformis f. sp. tritici PST-130]|nr:hypothetical protein H4Q26_011715 [Puccinia striiformis f. sp. tritici PST-130]